MLLGLLGKLSGADAPPPPTAPKFAENVALRERSASFRLEPDVFIHLNTPLEQDLAGKPYCLVFYALPNGSNLEQTQGRAIAPGQDWRLDLQHIAAQTRFLRRYYTNESLVVASLQAGTKSWPAWRKAYGDERIPPLLEAVERCFPQPAAHLILSGHSGGGSLIFGYLNTVSNIPSRIERIAFLDANYGYDPAQGHGGKLAAWLQTGPPHYLCVLAYNDAAALLHGTNFVSAAGGTWGKSHEMLRDFSNVFSLTTNATTRYKVCAALGGRLQFILKDNPERLILHTEQVARNGFIHSLLTGTPWQDQGYEYFGPRAYSAFVK